MASSGAARRSLRYAEARERVLTAARPLPAEEVSLAEARGRALAQTVTAPHPLPPFRNSSMDGIAVHSEDLAAAGGSSPVVLPVVEVVPAGAVPSRALRSGEAMRVMTGSQVPEGADAVVPLESVQFERMTRGGERVRLTRPAAAGESLREAGADVAAGEVVLAPGRLLSPHDIALLAALGIARPRVGARPRVAVLSTGDELLDAGTALRPGTIRDSNLPMVAALLDECGALLVRAARVSDRPEAVAAHIVEAVEIADVVITLGGVSAGDFDPVRLAVEGGAEFELWRVAMKPGQPQAFGTPKGRLYFGVPGNPASVACVFEALVRPALCRLQGCAELDRPRLQVRVAEAIESRAGRTDFIRVTLDQRAGEWWATPAGPQVSGHLAPQSRAHALLVVPEERASLGTGAPAEAWLWRWPETSRAPGS